jgi:hypothetical protein
MKSTLKTTAAVLRSITKEKDSLWAEDILGKSVHTIRHLEAGTLKLSASMAAKMNHESGISIKWLMDGDTEAPPITADGKPYTKEVYDNARARKKYFATVKDSDVKNTALDVLRAICAILVNANRKGKYHLAVYRTAKALAELRAEFGEAKDFASFDKVLAYVLKPFAPWSKDTRESVRRIQQMLRDNAPSTVEDLSASKRPSKKRRR